MKIELPPPLMQEPSTRSPLEDFKLLLKVQLRVTWNKIRFWPPVSWIVLICFGIGLLSLLVALGMPILGALKTMDPEAARKFLSILFMVGTAGLIFFGITAAFAALYLSDDLELLFVAPVSVGAVFAVKSLVVAGGNFLTTAFFVFVPGVFYGLLFGAGAFFYLWVFLAGLGLLIIGTALAEILNLLVMRLVPPHRSREAIGILGGIAGIVIALVFQIPNLVGSSGGQLEIGSWLAVRQHSLQVMDFFPWGWGSMALACGASGNSLAALTWSILLLTVGTALFSVSFLLVKKGFQRGWVSLAEGGKRRKKISSRFSQDSLSTQPENIFLPAVGEKNAAAASLWFGMRSIAKKDLLYLKRDAREWFGYLTPLIIMLFFVGQFLFLPGDSTKTTVITVGIIYTIMFSGNMALQSFGREGESEWVLNCVPLAGWPVVWGKLLAAVLPSLLLMEALLAGTALAIGLSPAIILSVSLGAVLITLGASSIGLYYSINNCRYNPDNPQQRISPGASLFMYLVNLLFIALIAFGLLFIFTPPELLDILQKLPPLSFRLGFPDILFFILYTLSRALLWPPFWRISAGLAFTLGLWSAIFFSFLSATVRQSRKGFRVEIVTAAKKKSLRAGLFKK